MKKAFNFIRIVILHFFVIILIYSCDDEKHQVIDVDIQKFSGRLNVRIDTIFCLETEDASIIGEVFKIKHYKGRYYALDLLVSKNLFLFNSEGRFISKLPRGKGPGEVLNPVEFFVNKERDLILLWDQGNRRVFEYDLDLNYVNCNHYDNLYINAGGFIDSNRILIYSPVFDNNEELENKVLYSIYNFKEREYEGKFFPVTNNLTSISPINPISVTSERVLFSAPFDNSLYILEDDGYRKAMHFDFGEMGITGEDIKKGNRYVFNESRAGRKIVPFYSISDGEKYMTLNFGLYGKDNFFIYSRGTKAVYSSFNLINEGLLPNCRLTAQIGEDQFLAFATPDDIIKYRNKNSFSDSDEAIKEVDEIGNPCIIIFSIHEES